MNWTRTLAASIILTLAPSWSAQADHESCGSDVSETLKRDYNEVPTALGLSDAGGVVVLYEGEKDGSRTFTLAIMYPSGMSCLLSSGVDWETVNTQSLGDPT